MTITRKGERRTNERYASIQKFLREQLENQKELEKAIKEKDLEKAEELVAKMIDRTQKGIEDN